MVDLAKGGKFVTNYNEYPVTLERAGPNTWLGRWTPNKNAAGRVLSYSIENTATFNRQGVLLAITPYRPNNGGAQIGSVVLKEAPKPEKYLLLFKNLGGLATPGKWAIDTALDGKQHMVDTLAEAQRFVANGQKGAYPQERRFVKVGG